MHPFIGYKIYEFKLCYFGYDHDRNFCNLNLRFFFRFRLRGRHQFVGTHKKGDGQAEQGILNINARRDV